MILELQDDHRAYIQRVFSDTKTAETIWTTPLARYMDKTHVPLDVTAGQFLDKQRRMWCELNRRIAMIPPRGSRCAGMAHVMLCCHLADTCSIHDATAMRIVNSCYEWQSLEGATRRPPISSHTSFRVIKQRMTPCE